VCTGTPVATTCTASDQCHDIGVCDATTGGCTNPPKPNGTICDDSNPCTPNSQCFSGVCEGIDLKPCPPTDQCHGAGTCDPATGSCSNPVMEYAGCTDGNPCTTVDLCYPPNGVCYGSYPKDCSGGNQCMTSSCNTGDGICTPVPNTGGSCTLTITGVCQSDGQCVQST
jgi:hypothetical protein